MSSSNEIKSHKTKLSLQRKGKKSNSEIVEMITKPATELNETCEFRSVEKMQKFFSGADAGVKKGLSRKGKSVKRNLNKNALNTIEENESKSIVIKSDDSVKKENSNKNIENVESPNLFGDIKVENENPAVSGITGERSDIMVGRTDADVIEIDCIDEHQTSGGTCVACGDQYSSQEMQTHLQTCFKAKFQRGVGTDDKQITAQSLNQEVKQEKVTEEECFFCQICQKDLTRLNSQRRTQHLNRCIDKEEEVQHSKDLEKKVLEDAKTAILDCPMCGRPCKTENARKVHVKKCSQKLNVPTEQVLKLMKKQEDEHQMLIAAGVVPKSTLSKLKTKSSSSTVLTKTKKNVKEPKSQFDADLQMAMAISMSETKTLEKTEPNKTKKKTGVGEPSLLVALSEEEKKARLQQRVSNMLLPQEDDTSDIGLTPEFTDSNMETKYTTDNTQNLKLWKRCSLQLENKENVKKDLFYVECLVPPIQVSKVIPGSKVRRMSEIPGRETSFVKPKTPLKFTQISRNASLTEYSGTTEETMVASTQTAVCLAELAANITQTTDLDCSGFCPEQPIDIQHMKTTNLLDGLQRSLLSMVNSATHSDIQIHTAGGDKVFGHKVIIGCRCPQLLQVAENGHISLKDICCDAVISLMKYIYVGQVSVTQSSLSDLVKLANRFGINELQEVLGDIETDSEMLKSSPLKSLYGASQEKESVESLLKQLWSDSEEDEDQVGGNSGSDDDDERVQDFISEEAESEIDQVSEDVNSKTSAPSESSSTIQSPSSMSVSSEYKSSYSYLNEKTSAVSKILLEDKLDVNKEQIKDDRTSNGNTCSLGKSKSESVNFENDELEVDSNVNLSFENSPQKPDSKEISNPEEFHQNYLETSPNKHLDHMDDDRELSPEIPVIKSSQNLILKSKNISNNPVLSYVAADIDSSSKLLTETASRHHTTNNCDLPKLCSPRKHRTRISSHREKTDHSPSDDLPKIESPRKSRYSKDSKILDKKIDFKSSPLGSLDGTMNNKYGENLFLLKGNNGNTNKNNADLNGTKDNLNYSKVSKEKTNNNTMHESFDKSSDSLIVIDEDDSNHSNKNINDNSEMTEHDMNLSRQNVSELLDKSDYNDTGFNTCLDVSGGDLFASPSPKLQRKNSQHSQVSQLSDISDCLRRSQQDTCASPKCDEETLASPAFRKSKRKTNEMDSPKFNSPSAKKFRICDVGGGDITITGDNLSDKDSDSPKFKVREKRKFKFSSRTNIVKSSDMTFSGSVTSDQQDQNCSNSPEVEQCGTYEGGETEDNLDRISNRETSENYSKQVNPKADSNEIDFHMNLTQSSFRKHSLEAKTDNSTGDFDDGFNDDVNLIDEESDKDMENNITVSYDMNITGHTNMDSPVSVDKIETCDDVQLLENGQRVEEDASSEMLQDDGVMAPEPCDVWDDFDDCGAGGFGGIVDCKTPYKSDTGKQVDQQKEMGIVAVDTPVKSVVDTSCVTPHNAKEEFENLTFCEEDSYFEMEDVKPSTSSGAVGKNSFKTPVEQNRRLKSNWKEPSPFTPMPNYDSMATPLIKKQVQSYGVKPVGKKRMIKLLKDIYHQTHQYETDSEFEEDIESEKDTRKCTITGEIDSVISEVSNDDDDDGNFNDSQDSQVSDLIEESFMVSTEEESQPLKPGEKTLEEKLMEFIKSQPDIQVQILMYEPLELDVLKQKISDSEIKCSMEKLKEFLDDKCITFTMKNMRKSPRKKRRSPKKGKPPKEGQGSPTKSQKSPPKGQGRGRKKLQNEVP